jgi:DNA-binding CsgD family transcriptional regulator
MIAFSVLESRSLSDCGKRASESSDMKTIEGVSLLRGAESHGRGSKTPKRTALLYGPDISLGAQEAARCRARAADSLLSTNDLTRDLRPGRDGNDVSTRDARGSIGLPPQTHAFDCEVLDPRAAGECAAGAECKGNGAIFLLVLAENVQDQRQGFAGEPSLRARRDDRLAGIKRATLLVEITSVLPPLAMRREILVGLLRAPRDHVHSHIGRGDELPDGLAKLTRREREVMHKVLQGHSNKNIAADLRISMRTVENHRAKVMKKTGSKSLPALVRLAIAAGAMPEASSSAAR